MRTGGLWFLGLSASAAAHALAALILVFAYAPEPVIPQRPPESRLHLETEEVRSQDAVPREPEAEAASEENAQGSALSAGRIPRTDATAARPAPERAPVVPATGERIDPAHTAGIDASAIAPPEISAATAVVTPELARPVAPEAPVLAAEPPSAPGDLVPEIAVPRTSAQSSLVLPTAAVAVTQPAADTALPQSAATVAGPALATLVPAAMPAPSLAAESETATSATPKMEQLLQGVAKGDAAAQMKLPEFRSHAELAWQFGDRVVTDPKALDTIQAFMSPEALVSSDSNAGRVRDDLAGLLAGVDCARISAVFLPDMGTIELRGHVPDPSMRAAILAAMKDEVGDGLPVTANLLHLPKPQCGALTGIADAGLPQSTDQFTNARLIGETAQAREYDYTEGQRLQFDLTAPDYDAYVYVDFFNAAGEVIHLVPNDTIPLERHTAESVFGVGRDRPGQPGLRITIGPPFGQEIAAAFAASVPLYDGLRPIVEPADDYLAFLKERVADARARTTDFKGEWVYFFITTSPASQ